VVVNNMLDLHPKAHLSHFDSTFGVDPGKFDSSDGDMKEAAKRRLNGILADCDERLVSAEFRGNSAFSIADELSRRYSMERLQKPSLGMIPNGAIAAASPTSRL